MRGKHTQGNMLAIVVAILFILITLVLGLHMSQSRAVRNVTQAEAELQFRQGYEFEVAKLLAKDEPIPSWVKVTGSADTLDDRALSEDYAKDLFGTLPDLNPLEQEFAPGMRTYKIAPTTSDAALQVFMGRTKWLVTQDSGGYAAYAPKGKIKLESAIGWANPTLDDEREAVDAYSGVQVILASKDELEVDDLPYGLAYSQSGELTIEGDGGIGFKGKPPLRAYEDKLVSELDSLKSTMTSAAASGNKTSEIEGGALETAGSMVTMLFGGDKKPGISLEQAMGIPFPMIPGFSPTVPGIVYELWFHMPHPSDFASFDDQRERDSEEDRKEAQRLVDEIEKLKKEIKDLEKKKRNASSQSDRDDIQEKIDKKKDKKRDLENEAEDLQEEMEKDADRNNDAVGNQVSSSPPDEPVTRNDDKNIPKTGTKGWAYSAVFEGFAELLLKTITGDFEGIASTVVNTVRVVHFGRKDNEPEFRFDDGFYAKATFTVPPGRTFRFNGNCEFEGDLWLQKGSVMHIGGNLRLSDPNGGSNNPFKASGKLVLEEGSTLVVDGNLDLEGSSKYGSLWVCSQAGTLNPITTGIFATGSVNIPHGSFTASSLEDVAKWVGKKEGAFNTVADVLKALFQDVAPNMSKVAGPFHMRKPFFAQYAATFQLTIVPTPIGPIPVPTAIPLPRKNILVPIFKGFTYLYTPMMNASLGENLYTHADWWGFGDGTVPVLVKLDPVAMAKALADVNLGGISLNYDFEAMLKRLEDEVLETAMQVVIEEVAKKLVSSVVAAAVPGGSLVTLVLDEAFTLITGETDNLAKLQEEVIDATLGPIITELERWADKLRNHVEDGLAEGYLREVNGPLIYADTISVGESSSPRLMAGMLVAKSSINIQARTFVGSLLCTDGDIEARRLYFNPAFTRVSLYKPKGTESNFLLRALQYEYGDRFDSKAASGVVTGVKVVRTDGWSR